MSFQTKATLASFGGKLLKLTHHAQSTSCEMALNLFLPPQAILNPLRKVPVLVFLSGLTCTGDNCAEKGFLQHKAGERGVAVVYPDTSPREFIEIGFFFAEGGEKGGVCFRGGGCASALPRLWVRAGWHGFGILRALADWEGCTV